MYIIKFSSYDTQWVSWDLKKKTLLQFLCSVNLVDWVFPQMLWFPKFTHSHIFPTFNYFIYLFLFFV